MSGILLAHRAAAAARRKGRFVCLDQSKNLRWTDDRGATWNTIASAVPANVYVGAFDPVHATLVACGASTAVYTTTDLSSWTTRTPGGTSYSNAARATPDGGLVIGSTSFAKSLDGGASWSDIATTAAIQAIDHQASSATGFAVDSSGYVHYDTGYGFGTSVRKTTTTMRTAACGDAPSIFLIAGDSNTILSGTTPGGVSARTSPFAAGTTILSSCVADDIGLAAIGASSALYATSTDGTSFTARAIAPAGTTSAMRLRWHPDVKLMTAIVGTTGSASCYFGVSADGINWTWNNAGAPLINDVVWVPL